MITNSYYSQEGHGPYELHDIAGGCAANAVSSTLAWPERRASATHRFVQKISPRFFF